MKKIQYLLSFCFAALVLALSSCTTVRHSTTQALKVHDTTTIAVHDTTQLHDTLNNTIVRTTTIAMHDTIIKVAGYATHEHIPMHSKIPEVYAKDTGNIHVRVTMQPDGSADIDVWDDSSQIVIQNLTRERDILTDSLSKVVSSKVVKDSTAAHSHDSDLTFKETITRTRSWLGRNWWWLALIVIIVIVAEIYGYIKKKEKNPLL